MLKSREGHDLPDVTFPVRVNDAWQKRNSDALFKSKKVALFALPGDPFMVSDADSMLKYFNPCASPRHASPRSANPAGRTARAHDVDRKGLSHRGERTRKPRHQLQFPASGAGTRHNPPQIYTDGQHIGGADELASWLAK